MTCKLCGNVGEGTHSVHPSTGRCVDSQACEMRMLRADLDAMRAELLAALVSADVERGLRNDAHERSIALAAVLDKLRGERDELEQVCREGAELQAERDAALALLEEARAWLDKHHPCARKLSAIGKLNPPEVDDLIDILARAPADVIGAKEAAWDEGWAAFKRWRVSHGKLPPPNPYRDGGDDGEG